MMKFLRVEVFSASIRTGFDGLADVAAAEQIAPSLAARAGQFRTHPLQVQLENILELFVEPLDFTSLGHPGPRLPLGDYAAPASVKLLQPQLRLREHRLVLVVEAAER